MNRTFHHNVSLQSIATIVLLAVVALWCFLVRSGITPALGFVCLLLGAAGVDRLVNTTYTFTADGDLVIARGRLGKSITIAVNEIIVARAVRGTLFTARHIVIEYGCGKITYAQPQQKANSSKRYGADKDNMKTRIIKKWTSTITNRHERLYI